MTCIVGYIDKANKTVYLGGDTVSVCGTKVLTRKDSKVFARTNPSKNTMLIGFTGSFRMGQLLRYKLIIPQHPEGLNTFEYMCTHFIDAVRQVLKDNGLAKINNNEEEIGTFLIAYNQRLFKVESDLQVGEIDLHYNACGNGEDYAIACMRTLSEYSREVYSAEEIVQTALKVSEDFCNTVKKPYVILKLEGDEK